MTRPAPTRVSRAAALVAAAIGCRPAGAHHQVIIDALAFRPETLVVRIGDTVTWTNRGPVPHTVTALGRTWDSGPLEAEQTWTLVVDASAPDRYECRYHPTMHAVLRRR